MKTLVSKHIDGVRFRLREDCDLGFLSRYGRVFRVFDQQDSGNIAFGVENGRDRVFVKVAGVRTVEYEGDPVAAVDALRHAVPLYSTLRHPVLIELLEHYPVGPLYAAVFRWVEGESLHPHWEFDLRSKYADPASSYRRFKALPLARRLAALDKVFSFVQSTTAAGYVALDLYDGSLVYDFRADDIHICDIDYFSPAPVVNHSGRLWGSSRFMSPEECERGAVVDEVSNVYTLGALAFMALGDERSRDRATWTGSDALFGVAQRAVSPQRSDRYPSVAHFIVAWNQNVSAAYSAVN